jgi:hypothetical protein
MRIVARRDTLEALRASGAVYLRPRALRCCGGRQYVLEVSTEAPGDQVERVHAADGFQVWATPGLVLPDELHFDLDRKGRLNAYWNNQSWIG